MIQFQVYSCLSISFSQEMAWMIIIMQTVEQTTKFAVEYYTHLGKCFFFFQFFHFRFSVGGSDLLKLNFIRRF